MKVDKRRPIDADPTLMNARIKEKKKLLKESRRPKSISDFVTLSDHMIKWFQDNPAIRNFLTYADRHGYTWSEFKSWRRESDYFFQAIERCMQICLERRETYLENENKLTAIYIREQPVYNPLLGDYEREMKQKDEERTGLKIIEVIKSENTDVKPCPQ